MIKRVQSYFYDRAASSKRVHPIYILPTLDGLKVVALNLILLTIGLIYANNYVLFFNFILFCLFLSSMFYTHFNISGLKLQSVQFPFLHAKEDGYLTLHFSSHNAQGHYFIRPYFKSKLLKISDKKKSFAITQDQKMIMDLPVQAIRRGQEAITTVYIETLFPFNFFRCFTYFKIDQNIIIYPERVNLNLHEEIELTEFSKEDDGEDFFIRNYQLGDSLKRVDWKKLAQTNQWYTRQFQSAKPSPILLVMDKTPVEETLQSICYSLHVLHQQNIKYGIKLKNKISIPPANSPMHLEQCLRELASYEA